MTIPLLINNDKTVVYAQEGCVLGFDFGEKRVGVAMGEHLLGIAHPLEVIETEATDKRFERITELVNTWQPRVFVVGYPLRLNGEEHAVTQLCKKFARRLNGRFNLPVCLVDERYSSLEASRALNEGGLSARQQKQRIDAVAAQQIVQRYFDNLSLYRPNPNTGVSQTV